ncbi:Elongation of very long chain fatty acids protein [Schistosoma japonicum]|nr:Elongation of very long chain fatty acids protein [Schistosoma japonicum]
MELGNNIKKIQLEFILTFLHLRTHLFELTVVKCALPETLTASVGRFATGLYWRLILLQVYICFLLHLECGLGTFHAFLNSIVHFFMYTYYGLAAAGPRFQKYIWWKKYLTTAQIIQFIIVILHSVYVLTIRDCSYPKLFSYWILSSAVIFLFLFSKFYSKTYNKQVHSMNEITMDSKHYNNKCY